MIAAVGEDVVGVAVASISGDVAWIEALGNRGFQATHGLVLYEKLEPLMPSEVGVPDDWGGDLLSSENWDLVAGMSAEKTLIESRIVGPLAGHL
jgi:hypothetical protein